MSHLYMSQKQQHYKLNTISGTKQVHQVSSNFKDSIQDVFWMMTWLWMCPHHGTPCSHMGRCLCQRVIWHSMQLSRALSAICMFCAIYPITTQSTHWANLRWRLGEKQGFCLCTMCGCCVSSCQNLVLTVRHALKLRHKPAAQKHRWCLCKHGCWIETIVLFNWRKIWWIYWSFAVVSSAEQFEQSIGNVQHTCMSAHLCQSRPEQSKVNTVP